MNNELSYNYISQEDKEQIKTAVLAAVRTGLVNDVELLATRSCLAIASINRFNQLTGQGQMADATSSNKN